MTRARQLRERVTGLVLAGGLARRMGGEDKGLALLAGHPMIEHVLDALRPQVGTVLISANRNLDRYAAYGCPVVADTLAGHAGPLAGVASALQHLATEYLLTVPCDAPFLAPDLASRLHAACIAAGAEAAVASDGRRVQPVFLLLGAGVAPSLQAYLDGGGRKVEGWLATLRMAQADFGDAPDCFVNVNEPAERQRAEAQLLASAAAHSPGMPDSRRG